MSELLGRKTDRSNLIDRRYAAGAKQLHHEFGLVESIAILIDKRAAAALAQAKSKFDFDVVADVLIDILGILNGGYFTERQPLGAKRARLGADLRRRRSPNTSGGTWDFRRR